MIITLEQVKEQLAFTGDIGQRDDALIYQKILAAQNHIERLLGFKIEDNFGNGSQEDVPFVLIEAICQLAAWWYEQREAASEGAKEVPFGVREIVTEYREFTF